MKDEDFGELVKTLLAVIGAGAILALAIAGLSIL